MTEADLLLNLTDSQRVAVTHGDGPLLVVAGPGSGKTRVITRRIAWLIAHGVPPWSILAITFTNKAAQEMARRVESLGAAPGAWVKTFHSSCAAFLRRYAERAGLMPGFSIFDTQDQGRIVRGLLRRTDLEGAALRPAAVRSRISRWKTGGLGPDQASASAAGFLERKLADVYRSYEQELRDSNAVDFDDLLVRTLRMLREDADVRGRLQRRFEYVLIDEYQDTSPVQFELASILADPQRNICATGDPDQSIYAFRNADVRNILEFERHYPGAQVVRLEENFRSVGNVLKAADALIQNNQARHEKRLLATKEDGPLVRVVGTDDEAAEGRAIAEAILDSYSRGVPYRDVAVFYRVNAQSRAIETGLRSRGIPYMIVKGVEFYQRAEVKDLLAYLKVLANPNDRESMTRVLTTPKRGIGQKTLEKLFALSRERGWSARHALVGAADSGELTRRATLALRDVSKLLDTLERGVTGSVAQLIRDTALLLRYEEVLKKVHPDDAQDRIDNVNELIGGAEEYDLLHGDEASLLDFLADVSLVADADQYDPDMPRVALMTLHSAKGLEFRHVYVAGVEESLLPHVRSTGDAAGTEEERRLLFVGMTRAKEHLTLSYARYRRAMITGNQGGGASSFLLELPEEVLEVHGAAYAPRSDLFAGPSARGTSRRSSRTPAPWAAGSDPVPSYDGIDEDPSDVLRVGQRVHHAKFGDGTIRRLSGSGRAARAVVFFRTAGEKTLALDHANLTPVWDAS